MRKAELKKDMFVQKKIEKNLRKIYRENDKNLGKS